jgi:adenylate cyclase
VQPGHEDPTVEATFAFIDLAGFTALTEAHGDAEAVNVIRAFRYRVMHHLRPGDRLVKTIGDAVMLTFPDPRRAVDALRAVLASELVHHDTVLLPRAGAHHGIAVAADGDFYGSGVNLAARVASQAGGGELLVTAEIAMAARDSGAVVTHLGAIELRNIPAPVDIYRVQIAETTAETAVDPVCQMRVPVAGPAAITPGVDIPTGPASGAQFSASDLNDVDDPVFETPGRRDGVAALGRGLDHQRS